MKGKWLGIVALLLAASSMVGCGSDDDNKAGGGDAALASCNAYCDATVAKACTDSATCKADECDGVNQASGDCATEMKRYYDCMKAQTDVCGQTCSLDIAKCT